MTLLQYMQLFQIKLTQTTKCFFNRYLKKNKNSYTHSTIKYIVFFYIQMLSSLLRLASSRGPIFPQKCALVQKLRTVCCGFISDNGASGTFSNMHVSAARAPRKPPRYRPVTRHAFVFIVISFYSTLSYWSSAPRGTNCMQDFIFFAEIMKGIPFLFLLKINLVTMDSVRINFTIYVLKNVISKTRASTLKAGT